MYVRHKMWNQLHTWVIISFTSFQWGWSSKFATLPSVFYRTLSKHFVESWIRRSAKNSNATMRRWSRLLCRVSTPRYSANMHPLRSAKSQTLGKASSFCRVSNSRHSAKLPPLLSVNSKTLGKDFSFCRVSNSLALNKVSFFAKCQLWDTRQRLAQNILMLASLASVTAQTTYSLNITKTRCVSFLDNTVFVTRSMLGLTNGDRWDKWR